MKIDILLKKFLAEKKEVAEVLPSEQQKHRLLGKESRIAIRQDG